MDSVLAIDKPMNIPDGKEADLAIVKEENRKIIKFDKTEH